MPNLSPEALQNFIVTLPVFLLAIILHEVAHAYVAYRCGDDTAKLSGRITLNPIPHIDPMGAIVFVFSSLAGRGIGWAKPVPINPLRFRHPRRDDLLVSLAGVAANALQALVWAGLIRVLYPLAEQGNLAHAAALLCLRGLELNLVLMVFNLIPLPPLDGSHVLTNLLNLRDPVFQIRFQQTGTILLFLLVFLAPGALGLIFDHTVDPLAGLLLRGL